MPTYEKVPNETEQLGENQGRHHHHHDENAVNEEEREREREREMCGCVREYQERGFNRVERLSAKIRTVDLPIIIGGMISPVFKCDPFILPFSKVNNTDKRDYLQPSLFISIWL